MAAKEYGPLRSALTVVSAVVYIASSLAALPLAWAIVLQARAGHYEGALVWGLLLLGLVLLVVLWYVAAGLINVLADTAEETARLHRTTRAASDRQAQMLADIIERLDGLAHWTAMSDETRRLLTAKREADVFVQQIEKAIGEGDWVEADRLIRLFAEHFKDESKANSLRYKMVSGREAAADRVIRTRISEIRTMIDQHNFPAAELALTRLANDYPKDNRLDDLRSTFLRARRRYSESAQMQFHQLLGERNLVQASTLLDELRWLDDDTLHWLRDQWKEAFRRGQHESRQAFSAAVKEKRWAKAAESGERILTQFPRTPLAAEVGKLIDGIRQRAAAAEGQAAPPTPAEPPSE